MMNLLNAGCGTHYAKGWVNADVWQSDSTKPDVLVEPNTPYPFDDNYFDAIYLGHVLEHIDWVQVPAFLKDMYRIAKPGGHILIVGPDVFKTIKRWAEGKEPWEMVLSTMEHQEVNWDSEHNSEFWDGATHHWNCHHQRVWDIVQQCGFVKMEDYYSHIPNNATGSWWPEASSGITWPVVGKWFWQFAIKCRKPE